MEREVLFGQILEKVRKRAGEQGNVIAKEEVEEAFAPLGLDGSQMELVFDYLKKHKIGVDEAVHLDDYLDHGDRDYLKLYLKELEALERRGEEEREAITLSAMAGDKEAKQALIHLYLPDAVDLAKLYTGQGVILEDLIGEANVALALGVEMLGALESVSEARGMLARKMMDAMEDAIAENGAAGEKGKLAAEKVGRVAAAARELAGELRRKVTVEELMRETGMAREEIEDALRFCARKIEEIQWD